MSSQGPNEKSGITVVIPAYNYERYLGEAIASCLEQDYDGILEVLVVDDGSTDGTGEVARGFGGRIRYHRKQNAGLSAARNTGMERATHDWVLFLDADDLLEPAAVRRLVAARDERDGLVVVGSLGRMINAEGEMMATEVEGDGALEGFTTLDFVQRNRFPPIVLANRWVLMGLGGFDPALKASEDRDMWIRASTVGKVARLNERLHRKRDHGDNMSRQAARQTASILQVLAKTAANPAVKLTAGDLRKARAICLFQSARMHLAAGDRGQAVRQCLKSIWAQRWVRQPGQVGLPALFRLRFLGLRVLELFRTRPN